MKRHTLQKGKAQDTEEHWISISDMMAGLMVIFLFIAISYMLHVSTEKESIEETLVWIEEIVETYRKSQADLYEDLQKEFSEDFDGWNAVVNGDTLSIRFEKTDVLFPQGGAEVSPEFRRILYEFFPRYVKILTETKNDSGEYKYKNDIAELRIEGHTSSEWNEDVTPSEAYINNMELSQDRTRNVLEIVLQISKPEIIENREWIKYHLTANGLSSSKLIDNSDGTENPEESRRVEFRVLTNAEKRIMEIIKRVELE